MTARGILAAALIAIASSAASAGTILVDVDALLDNTDNPVVVTLEAGTYSVTPVAVAGGGAYDAWNPWGETSCETPTGCLQTSPTTLVGWKISYDVVSDAITAVSVSGTPLAPVAVDPSGISGIQYYWLANESEPDRYHVDNSTIYPTAADAFAGAESSEFTLSAPGPVGFAIHDGFPSDNTGGMSLAVTAVPEPSATLLLCSGVAALLLCSQIRRGADH